MLVSKTAKVCFILKTLSIETVKKRIETKLIRKVFVIRFFVTITPLKRNQHCARYVSQLDCCFLAVFAEAF